jgi:C4-dicarboxylate-binding protein DctP
LAHLAQSLAEFAARCGAEASEIALEKLPEAVKAGQIDMIPAEIDALETDELWRVADTITRLEHTPMEAVLIINEGVWQSLTPAHRPVLTTVAANIERDARKAAEKAEADDYVLAVAKGMKVHDLKPDDVADWRACSAEMLADFLNKAGSVGERLMAACRKLRANPCCTGPAEGSHGFTRR